MYVIGEPIKAEDLPTKRKIQEDFLEDPRPAKHRNVQGYNDRVRNILINFCSQTSQSLAFMHLFKKADIKVSNI